ncbi:hypothetical protein [uncultured Tateyamaria sp.]|uniref:hypothetical protein n=1 Tax=uncultured Tateyamaria sp. TaxID=455651 RepID=UPI00261FCB4F|nr:hypothetical protein [uncultured Tateyamaria sp.]
MDHQTVAINLWALRRLRKHMRKNHPQELKKMIAHDPNGKLNDLYFGGRNGGELGTLQNACTDPTLFPVHVLADDEVVRLIKRVQRGTVGSLWFFAARVLWQSRN